MPHSNEKLSNSNHGRVGWLCSYTPEEIIYAAGFQPYRLLPLAETAGATDRLLPPTLCPYVRQVARNLESGAYGELKGLVITNSCNAMIHLYSVLEDYPGIFVYLLDLPRQKDTAAELYFAARLEEMARFLGRQGKEISAAGLLAAIELYRETERLLLKLPGKEEEFCGATSLQLHELTVQAATMPRREFNELLLTVIRDGSGAHYLPANGLPSLLLTGAMPARALLEILSSRNDIAVYQENCVSSRYFHYKYPETTARVPADRQSTAGLLQLISRAYLHKIPCPRSFNVTLSEREQLYRRLLQELKPSGVLFHDLSFCDLSHYDYLLLNGLLSELKIPLLKLKTELGQADSGQIQTRLEAFLEMIT
jgi:benzoyl-CoA reductase/2-hydroxyglutaryl-CoA dehydratase subunit BcrC/BadD/HgdB